MQALFTHLTAGLLLVQVLTGWCWRCAVESPACTSHTQPASRCCCDPKPEEHQPEAPANCPRECQGVCVYVAPSGGHVDFSLLDSSLDFGVIATDLSHSQFSVAYWERIGEVSPPRTPLRLHLLHQLLLI